MAVSSAEARALARPSPPPMRAEDVPVARQPSPRATSAGKTLPGDLGNVPRAALCLDSDTDDADSIASTVLLDDYMPSGDDSVCWDSGAPVTAVPPSAVSAMLRG